MKQGKSSESDYELGGIHSDFCFHCFVKYDTVAERSGFTRSLRIRLVWVGLLSLSLPSTVVTHVLRMYVISTILPELDCIECVRCHAIKNKIKNYATDGVKKL